MSRSVRLGRLARVPLRMHWTVPLLLVLFGFSLGSQTLPAAVPDQSDTVYTVAALAGALLLLASLVAHEVAHAVAARSRGITVEGITLWALGGMTRMGRPRTAGSTFWVAVIGPLTSLLVGALALGAGAGLGMAGWAVPAAVLLWVGWMNLFLALFNLLPAAPLDGGRVVQALAWWRTGDRDRAERTAARGGQVLGVLLIVLGWIIVLRGSWSGLWLAIVGLFVVITAAAEHQRARFAPALRGLRASDAMSSPVETCQDWLTVQRFIDDIAVGTRHSAVVLIDFQGRPSGLLHVARLAGVPAAQRDTLRVRDVATPWTRCTTCSSDAPLQEVYEMFAANRGLPVIVTEGDRLAGVITGRDISRLAGRLSLRGS